LGAGEGDAGGCLDQVGVGVEEPDEGFAVAERAHALQDVWVSGDGGVGDDAVDRGGVGFHGAGRVRDSELRCWSCGCWRVT
jgi:hypothetical protein